MEAPHGLEQIWHTYVDTYSTVEDSVVQACNLTMWLVADFPALYCKFHGVLLIACFATCLVFTVDPAAAAVRLLMTCRCGGKYWSSMWITGTPKSYSRRSQN